MALDASTSLPGAFRARLRFDGRFFHRSRHDRDLLPPRLSGANSPTRERPLLPVCGRGGKGRLPRLPEMPSRRGSRRHSGVGGNVGDVVAPGAAPHLGRRARRAAGRRPFGSARKSATGICAVSSATSSGPLRERSPRPAGFISRGTSCSKPTCPLPTSRLFGVDPGASAGSTRHFATLVRMHAGRALQARAVRRPSRPDRRLKRFPISPLSAGTIWSRHFSLPRMIPGVESLGGRRLSPRVRRRRDPGHRGDLSPRRAKISAGLRLPCCSTAELTGDRRPGAEALRRSDADAATDRELIFFPRPEPPRVGTFRQVAGDPRPGIAGTLSRCRGPGDSRPAESRSPPPRRSPDGSCAPLERRSTAPAGTTDTSFLRPGPLWRRPDLLEARRSPFARRGSHARSSLQACARGDIDWNAGFPVSGVVRREAHRDLRESAPGPPTHIAMRAHGRAGRISVRRALWSLGAWPVPDAQVLSKGKRKKCPGRVRAPGGRTPRSTVGGAPPRNEEASSWTSRKRKMESPIGPLRLVASWMPGSAGSRSAPEAEPAGASRGGSGNSRRPRADRRLRGSSGSCAPAPSIATFREESEDFSEFPRSRGGTEFQRRGCGARLGSDLRPAQTRSGVLRSRRRCAVHCGRAGPWEAPTASTLVRRPRPAIG